MEKKSKQQLKVTILDDVKGVVWEGTAQSVSSVNSQGAFDVLPQHANFITLIRQEEISVRTGVEENRFKVDTAVVYVHDNHVNVYSIVSSK